jgi:phage terminase large subunit-like protein
MTLVSHNGILGAPPAEYSAEQYIAGVLDGSIIVGGWVRKAMLRHQADLKRTDIYFDPEAGQRPIDFLEKFCIPSAQTTPIVLMPWQRAVLYIVYGWKKLNGFRRFRRAYLEVSKKQGKTGMSAGLALNALVADGELSARVFCAGVAMKQAREIFNEAVHMRDKHPLLRKLIQKSGEKTVTALYVPGTASRLSPMAKGSDSADGAIVSTCFADELHRWKLTENLWSVLRFGGDTRNQPLMWCLTTAGASAGKSSLCWSEHEYCEKILDGMATDDEVAAFIFSLDPKDNYKDPNNWIKPSPSLGYIMPLSALLGQFNESQGKPTSLGEFKRFRLNIWSDLASSPAIEIEDWDACATEDTATHPDPKRLRAQLIASLKGRPCLGGIDLAPMHDTSAIVLLFPPTKTGEKWSILEWFWVPQDDIQEKVKKNHVPYDTWSREGYLTATPGNMTDFRYISEQLIAIEKQFDLRQVGYDASWSAEFIRLLIESGFHMDKMVPILQKPNVLNPACQELMRKVIKHEFEHSHNPVARNQMANLRWYTQHSTGYLKPDRDRKREKIDFCASLVMALDRCLDPDNTLKPKQNWW